MFERVEDVTKLDLIARYLRDRALGAENESDKHKWLEEWPEVYPNLTRTVLYQALIFSGEHALAKELGLFSESKKHCI